MSEKPTMVHALREEPGSYTRSLEGGEEVIYEIRACGDGFVAAWRRTGTGGAGTASGHEERFSSHADALEYLAEHFDAPLREGGT